MGSGRSPSTSMYPHISSPQKPNKLFNTHPIKKVFTQTASADFGQGVAAQEW
jgi:hypothetical protein